VSGAAHSLARSTRREERTLMDAEHAGSGRCIHGHGARGEKSVAEHAGSETELLDLMIFEIFRTFERELCNIGRPPICTFNFSHFFND